MQRNVIQSLIIVTLFVSSANAWCEGMVYKCKNQEGALIYQKAPCMNEAYTLNSWKPKEAAKPLVTGDEGTGDMKGADKESTILTLKQSVGGHYSTDGNVDGKSLSFVVDTGASFVSLPESLAHDAQIYCDKNIGMNTANGKTDACTAKIKKLQFGPFVIQEVDAVIVPNLSQPLLGMNVLGLFKIAQDKGEMKISVLGKEDPENNASGE
jgi:clan AA aspartic protease (TIGR02281 family)